MSSVPAQRKKIHPHKFSLWLAMASIVMMFAGLTSAYIVRKAQGNWVLFELPWKFWASTVVILGSSVTMHMALRSFKARRMPRFRALMITTLILGLIFGLLQYLGFRDLYAYNIRLEGNPSESFVFIIAGLHLLHILGGLLAMIIVFFRANRRHVKVYNPLGIELVATYWHFVDILWIYLFIFFLANQ